MPDDQQQTMPSRAPEAMGAPQSSTSSSQSSALPGAIYTMPDKFMGGATATPRGGQTSGGGGGSGKKMVLIIGIVAIFLGGLTAGAYFYINSGGDFFGILSPTDQGSQNTQPSVNQPVSNQPVAPVNADQNTNEQAPSQEEAAQRARDAQRVQDVVVIAKALQDYYTKFNAYPQLLQVIPKDILPNEPKDPLTQRLYAYTTRDSRQSYSIIIEAELELNFNDKSYAKGTWEFYPEDFNGGVPPATDEPPAASNPELGNIDADSDGLTAAEEALFGTSAVNPDTDSDGYRDNIELTNFYSPLEGGAIKLDQAGIVKLYTNETLKYRFFYPTSWVVSVPDSSTGEVLITSGTGEDFRISVEDNIDGKTSWEWYTQNVSHDFNPNSVTITTIAGHEAIKTLDGLGAYVAVGNRVFVLRYQLNTEAVIRYPAVFGLLLDHFTIL